MGPAERRVEPCAAPGSVANTLPRAARIRRGSDIRRLLRRGRRGRTRIVDVYVGDSSRPLGRVGWVVPKLGNRIVDRNRLKRRIREIGRLRVLPRMRERGWAMDVLVRVRRPAYRASYRELENQVLQAMESACRQIRRVEAV